MLAEGANEDGAHHWEDYQGFCIIRENLPHALVLQLKYLSRTFSSRISFGRQLQALLDFEGSVEIK